MILFSPAKINFFLRVLDKRSNGYHSIASLFSALNIGDYLDIDFSATDAITSTNPLLGNDVDNLVFVARNLLRKYTKNTDCFTVTIHKHIPLASGLGGGSSNAATTLWGINHLLGSPCNHEELVALARQIGADVPFFFSSGMAYCSGIGEICEDVPYVFDASLYLLIPNNLRCSTKTVYRACIPGEVSQTDPRQILAQFFANDPFWVNDLQPAAFRVNPQLSLLYRDLQKCFAEVYLTGSGSAFYAFHQLKQKIPDGVTSFCVNSLLRDPQGWYTQVI